MINNEHNMTEKAWIVTVDMGYGHQRAVHALGFLGKEGVLTIGESEYTSAQEKKLWKRMLNSYEYLSRAKNIPLIGKYLFRMMDKLLYIPSFYPKRNLSQKTFQVSILNHYISKGICSGVLTKIKENTQIPLITSFYAPAIAADIAGFPEIYCIICDADLNRVWVASDPAKSRIKYLAPCYRSAQRLKSYGVPKQRIFITGFPFSFDLVGSESLDILRKDLAQRLFYLDPNYRFWNIHRVEIEYYLGKDLCTFKKERNLTIMYAVGGAGAQKEIAEKIALSLFDKIRFNF